MRAILFVVLITSPLASAADAWVFIRDGRVGTGDPETDPVRLLLPDKSAASIPKTEILFTRTAAQVNDGVCGMVSEILDDKNLAEHAKRFRVLGASAVPPLLEFLEVDDRRTKLAALFGLQHAWTAAAEEPVLRSFAGGDADIRKGAFGALKRHLHPERLALCLKEWADVDDLATAALVFDAVDAYHPDATLARIKRLLAAPEWREGAALRLPHYLSPSLSEHTYPLLDSKKLFPRRHAVVALISQLSTTPPTREHLHELLADRDGELHEITGEYFAWLGTSANLSKLEDALRNEGDPHVRASLTTAVELIRRRSDRPTLTVSMPPLQSEDTIEPLFIYEVHEHADKHRFLERAYRLQDALMTQRVQHNLPFVKQIDIPAVTEWVPPVREYFDERRKSFGITIAPKKHATFGGCVHIGDDCGWGADLRTVVSAAAGVVRSVSHIFSWGFIIVIEHEQKGGERICTLYAHLSPLLHVKPGDVVTAGQKIGSIGRSNTVENGGYFAHLHFGVHRGPYSAPSGNWICGYVSTQTWNAKRHGWLDPQQFLRANVRTRE
jgi:murein DD-endopeptidase MepM/ murein hydrolase activator NlpD